MSADDAGASAIAIVAREARPEEHARIGDLALEADLGLPDGHEHPDHLERLRDPAGRSTLRGAR